MAEPPPRKCRVFGRKPERQYEGSVQRCFRSDHLEYVAFLGIPYAAIPEGMQRYQAPESLPESQTSSEPTRTEEDNPAPSTSSTVYEANVKGKHCFQMKDPHLGGSADCLYLNIFLPRDPDHIKERLPVLVFIHGGGFISGSNDPDDYSPEFIVQFGVILVTINYRLGLYGFFNARTREFSGNTGLKDQVKALEWIRDNIECFKGDPNNVTISGWSAGATCVNLHLISPASKDLFHKAIVQSGGVYCLWGYRGHRFEQKKTILGDAGMQNLLRNETADEQQLHECAYDLLRTDRKKRHEQSSAPYFGPSVEKFPEDAFISDDLEEMMKEVVHDKPVMAGITKDEALEKCHRYNFNMDYKNKVNSNQYFRQFLMDHFRWSMETATKHMDKIRDKYFPGRETMSLVDSNRYFANFLRDVIFRRFYDCYKFGPEKSLHKNLYVYRFDHHSEICLISSEYDPIFREPTHGEDMRYMYCPKNVKEDFQENIFEGRLQNRQIRQVINHMCSLWTNFCKTGVPKSEFDSHVEWRRHSEENPCYLSISNNLVLKEEPLFKDEWDWLNELVNSEPTIQSQKITPEDDEESAEARMSSFR